MQLTPSTAWMLLLAASAAVGTPIRSSRYALKESHNVPRRWTNVGPAPGDHVLNLNIALKQGQFEELERHLYEVSDPDHHRYGNHLTTEEVENLVKPSDDTLSQVKDWLAGHGVDSAALSYSPAKDWVKIAIPVSAAERLLDTKYSVYLHEDGTYLIRTPNWSLPEHLHEHIETVQPTNSFFRPQPRGSLVKTVEAIGSGAAGVYADVENLATLPANPTVQQACNASAVTPTCLRTLYGTINYKPQVPGQNKVGLTDYLGEANNRSDVSIFLQKYRPDAVKQAYEFNIQVINNGDNQQTPNNATQLTAGKDLEGNLDAETIIGIDYPTPLYAFTTGGSPPYKPDDFTPTDTNEPYLTWLQTVLKQQDLPQVISNSYADDEQSVPPSYANTVCKGFAQLGARGVSLFFGSGDDGVGSAADCFTNDGRNASTFLADFPSSCPYVTTVGATKNIDPEVAAYDAENGFASGGGFSRYFARPAYQDAAVKPYLQQTLGSKFSGLYNSSGRAYPDVSAQGYRFLTIWNGTIVPLDGTSAATPTVAAVVALVNDALLAAGKPVLGFLNPWLYKKGYKGFKDVTSGSAIGCNGTGFPAAKGWDAVTGFGTPYFPELKALAMDSY